MYLFEPIPDRRTEQERLEGPNYGQGRLFPRMTEVEHLRNQLEAARLQYQQMAETIRELRTMLTTDRVDNQRGGEEVIHTLYIDESMFNRITAPHAYFWGDPLPRPQPVKPSDIGGDDDIPF